MNDLRIFPELAVIHYFNFGMNTKLRTALITGGAIIAGLTAGVGAMASAQTLAGTTTASSTVQGTSTSKTTVSGSKIHGHAPLGGDGIVSSINGNTVVMAEESDEGGTSYTIDASGASVTKDGVAAKLSDIQVGAKIFVQGTTTGTSVMATTISLGHPEFRGSRAHNTDINGATSTNQ